MRSMVKSPLFPVITARLWFSWRILSSGSINSARFKQKGGEWWGKGPMSRKRERQILKIFKVHHPTSLSRLRRRERSALLHFPRPASMTTIVVLQNHLRLMLNPFTPHPLLQLRNQLLRLLRILKHFSVLSKVPPPPRLQSVLDDVSFFTLQSFYHCLPLNQN